MEVRVQLKICEGCGCLWYRTQAQKSVYCKECEEKLKNFPSPESRKRRGRPSNKRLARVWAVAEAAGGSL
jgi:predicted amidophosphoribosyltransferase